MCRHHHSTQQHFGRYSARKLHIICATGGGDFTHIHIQYIHTKASNSRCRKKKFNDHIWGFTDVLFGDACTCSVRIRLNWIIRYLKSVFVYVCVCVCMPVSSISAESREDQP